MKRRILAISLLVVLLITSLAYASPKVTIDGKNITFDVEPTIVNGRTMVPFRKIFEELGLNVEWDGNQEMAIAYNEQTYVAIKLKDTYGSIDGKLFQLDSPASLTNGRVLVPLRFISEAFGNAIEWNASTQTAAITSGFAQTDTTDPLPVVGTLEKLQSLMTYNNRFNNTYYDDRVFMATDDVMRLEEKAVTESEASAPANTNDGSFSETNVQVQGVDEADIVKTDGTYIYHVRQSDVRITETYGDLISAVSTISLEDGYTPSEIYLKNNKLILVGSESFPSYFHTSTNNGIMEERMIMPYESPSTKVIIYDLADKSKPKKVRELFIEGSYLTSRMIDNHFYLIANQHMYHYYDKKAELRPHFKDSLNNAIEAIDYKDIRYFPDATTQNYLILAGLNLDALSQKADLQTFMGSGDSVYMSKNNLYVAVAKYQYQMNTKMIRTEYNKETAVYKFAVQNGTFKYLATGEVKGHLLNQFSMDEYKNDFRIATTSGNMWMNDDQTSKNNIYTLDSNMRPKGKLEGIAPGERIYSVRFLSDRCYMVTFRQVDPFFVINMNNPYSPQVLGYLKIPGYSDYLHPYDENTIIGFGKDTIETKNGVRTEGFKMAMFDVSDVSNPIEKHKVSIGDSGTHSQLLNTHKALLFDKNRNTIGFPITVRTKNTLGNTSFSFQGAYVYTVTPSDGFLLRGTSTHLNTVDYKMAGDYWYGSDKNIERLVYIGDHLYSVSKNGIKVHNFDDMRELSHFQY